MSLLPATEAYRHHFWTSSESRRKRLQVNHADRGWIVSRPNAQVDDGHHAVAEWLLQKAHDELPILTARLLSWRNTTPVALPIREILFCYFKVPLDGTDRHVTGQIRKILEKFLKIDAGIRNDPELQLVDVADEYRSQAKGYVTDRIITKGRIHLDFPSMRMDEVSYGMLIHEASHKFAGTDDYNSTYFNTTNVYRAFQVEKGVGLRVPNLFKVPDIGGLDEAHALNLADSYGCFAAEFGALHAANLGPPWQ